MNTFSALEPISRNPDKLVATGIAGTAKALGYKETPELKKRILALISDPQKPLTETELNIIEDAITSVPGWDLLSEANHELFCDFDYTRKSDEEALCDLTLSGLANFETGWINKHRGLQQVSAFVASFAREEKRKEPAHITASDIWKQIQNKQFLAVNAENKRLFLEACSTWRADALHEWTKEWGNIQLRYDPVNNLMGALDSEEGILDDRVLSGYRPIPHMEMFYGDEWTVLCTSDTDHKNLCLVEFNPNGMWFFQSPRWHFNTIESKSIHQRGIIKSLDGTEMFYCVVKSPFGDEKVIHSGPGGGHIRSNQPLELMDVHGDKICIAHESSGSCAHYTIHSLQTGWYTKIPLNNIQEDTKIENDRIFTLRVRDSFGWTLHCPGRENTQWKFGNDLFAKWKVSIQELVKVWHKAAEKAKERK